MKVLELLEDEKKMAFTAVFRIGRHSREQRFTDKTIAKCKALTPAEIKQALKLTIGGTLNTHFEGEEGRTMVQVTRIN